MTSPSHPRVLTRRGGERARGERARGEQRARPRRCFIGDVIRQRSRTLSNAVQNLIEAYDIRNDVERVFKATPQQQLKHVPQESLQQEEPEQLTQEELNNVEQAIDNQHPAQDIYAALSSLSKDKLLLLQKDLRDRMVRSDDCLSNCNQDNSWRTRTTSTKQPVFRVNAPPTGPEPPDLDPDPPDPDPPISLAVMCWSPCAQRR